MRVEAIPPPRQAKRGRANGTPGRWRQLALLGGLMCVDGGESTAASVMFPALRTALGLPLSALSVLIAVSKLVGATVAPVWVIAAHRFPRKRVLAVSCGFWGVWTIGTGFAQSFPELLALFTIAAIGVAGGAPLVNGFLADLFDDRTRGRAVGLLRGDAFLHHSSPPRMTVRSWERTRPQHMRVLRLAGSRRTPDTALTARRQLCAQTTAERGSVAIPHLRDTGSGGGARRPDRPLSRSGTWCPAYQQITAVPRQGVHHYVR